MQMNVQTSAQADEEVRGVLVLAMYGNTEGCGLCWGVAHPPLGLPEAVVAPSVVVSPVGSQVCVQSARLTCHNRYIQIQTLHLKARHPQLAFTTVQWGELWSQTSAMGVLLERGS